MRVVVVGCGRSGTNIALEALAGNSHLKASAEVEDKRFFKRTDIQSNGYLTKCDTCYFTSRELAQALERDPELRIVWTLRDPRDMILSKMYRGRPTWQGGDCNTIADDATVTGVLEDINDMFAKYIIAKNTFHHRIYDVHMEGMLATPEHTFTAMCIFLDIPYEQLMLNFPQRMRNAHKRKRYKDIDKSQLELWKRWDSVYDGFFKDNPTIPMLFDKIQTITQYFGYASRF